MYKKIRLITSAWVCWPAVRLFENKIKNNAQQTVALILKIIGGEREKKKRTNERTDGDDEDDEAHKPPIK